MVNIAGQRAHFSLSKKVRLNNLVFHATVKWKIDKVGGNLGKKIFYDWDGGTY
jgi:hypothetical protein